MLSITNTLNKAIKMTLSKSIMTCMRKYATFTGRASRSEYWWFFLFTQVLLPVSYILVAVAAFAAHETAAFAVLADTAEPAIVILLPGVAVAHVALFVPLLAVGARRLHDSGKSGWWQLLNCALVVPIFGVIAILALMALLAHEGTKDENKYGPAVHTD
ncbi:MAG: DUF805 domain-containing protein [Gammaproteobacteria bacterium]